MAQLYESFITKYLFWKEITKVFCHESLESEMVVSHVEASLSEYTQGLSVSDKRRYIEKISGIQDHIVLLLLS